MDSELRRRGHLLPRSVLSAAPLWLIRGIAHLRIPQFGGRVRIHNEWIRTDGESDLRVRIYTPRTDPRPAVLLWMHGGGFVLGTPEIDDAHCCAVVASLGLTIVSVNYRLAPEHPFPAALDDALRALAWTQSGGATTEPPKIAVGGRSAGGGLAATVALAARDRGVQLAGQLLLYPMLDDRTVLREDIDDAEHRLWSRSDNVRGWKAYLGATPGGERVDSRAVPSRRTDLDGLAPAWIGVGTDDLFHAEDLAYAARLTEAGVSCTTLEVNGAYHGFDAVSPYSRAARAFLDSQLAVLGLWLPRGL